MLVFDSITLTCLISSHWMEQEHNNRFDVAINGNTIKIQVHDSTLRYMSAWLHCTWVNHRTSKCCILLGATRPHSLPQYIWILLHFCFYTMNTLKLLLPLLSMLSIMPSLHLFFLLLSASFSSRLFSINCFHAAPHSFILRRYSLSSSLISLSIHCPKNHRVGKGSAKHSIVTHLILHMKHTWFHMTSNILHKKIKIFTSTPMRI